MVSWKWWSTVHCWSNRNCCPS